jgi:hypothetical protein
VGVSSMHESEEPLRERLQGVVFIGVVREGDKRVCIDVLSDSHGPFCKEGVPWGDLDVSGECSAFPARDGKGGELAVVWDEVARVDVMARDDRGQGCLLMESGDLLLEVMDHVLIGSGTGDEGLRGSLGDISEALTVSPGFKSLKDGKSRTREEGRGDLNGGCDTELVFFIHLDANTW